MGSKRTRIFTPSQLQVIERACEAAWAKIATKYPDRDTEKDERLRARLRKKIFASVGDDSSGIDTVGERLIRNLPPERWIDDTQT